MASPTRYTDEPAFVLHRHDWSESSLILDVFTRHMGRVALVAKGAKRPTSQLRPVLLPLQPLLLAWSGDGEVRTLKTAHWRGGHVMPVGESLLSGIYLNEMLLKLLARDDPHPVLFDVYTQAVARLAESPEPWPGVLRAFELTLLREAGFLPSLAVEGHTLAPLEPGRRYGLEADHGLVASEAAWDGAERPSLLAEQWQALQQALDQRQPFNALLQVLETGIPAALQTVLRGMLHYHSGVRVFKTRQMMRDVHSLARR